MALHSYTPLNWQNAPGHKTTPTSAENFNHIETGIANAYSDIAELANDIDGLIQRTDIASVESGTTASKAYSAGELVYIEGVLYRVKTSIASGASFTIGTNVVTTTVESMLPGYPDYSNALGAVNTRGASLTAPADGWLIGSVGASEGKAAWVYADGSYIGGMYANAATGYPYQVPICVPIRKGTVITTRSDSGTYSLTLWGKC